jgi:hypothetical protein
MDCHSKPCPDCPELYHEQAKGLLRMTLMVMGFDDVILRRKRITSVDRLLKLACRGDRPVAPTRERLKS